MSRYRDLRDKALAEPSETQPATRWLDPGDQVEVLWTDADDKPQLAVGRLKGVEVPAEGGPSYLVLEDDGAEVALHTKDVVGVTVLADSG
jgi:hypothetical protein